MAKDNTPSSFVLSQETDGVPIGEDQVRQIQDKDATSRLGVNQLAKFVDIVRTKLAADREHNRSAAHAIDFQHRRLAASNAIARPFEKSLKVRASGRRGEAKFRQWRNAGQHSFRHALAPACESGFC
jgi:hypothetical protein